MHQRESTLYLKEDEVGMETSPDHKEEEARRRLNQVYVLLLRCGRDQKRTAAERESLDSETRSTTAPVSASRRTPTNKGYHNVEE